MSSHSDIEALIARIAKGDRQAFAMLYDATSPKLNGIALRIMRDQALADDVLRDVYVRIWHKAGQYRPNGFSPMTWLITVTRNMAVDRLRALRASGDISVSPEIAERLYDPLPKPGQLVTDEARALDMCLRELPPERANMIRRAYFEGQSYADLAEATETPERTVRMGLRRCIMQLRECLSR